MTDDDNRVFMTHGDMKIGWKRSTNELTVNGRPVVTKSLVTLSMWQGAGAIIAVIAAALGGVLALLQIVDWLRHNL